MSCCGRRPKSRTGRAQLLEAKLKAAAKRAEDRAGQLKENIEAKVKELESQAAKATGEAKAKIEQRIEADRADYQRRAGQLKQAWEATKQAYIPGARTSPGG